MSPATAPIPLLLVADSAETCERVASALLSAPAFYRIERVTSTDLAQGGPPTGVPLALVDYNLRSAKQAQVVQRLNAAGIAAVAFVDPRDVQALQEVVLAGAAALVATPFVDTQLWETVARALASGARPVPAAALPPTRAPGHGRQGIVVAVYAPKGGSGSSVLAANLAVSLQDRAAHGAVLVEMGEGAGSQAILLNLRPERTLGDLLARFDPSDSELLNGVLTTHSSGLRVLLAPPSQGVRVPADLLDEVIETLQRTFDFVIVDLHTSALSSTVTTLRKAHAALVVIVPEMTALHHGRLFVDMVASTMPDIHLNIILNRSTMAAGVPPDAIRRHLKMQIAAEVPDDGPLVSASVNRGVPLVISHSRSAVARAIQKLAQDLAPAEGGDVAHRLAGLARTAGPLARLGGRGRR
jgi:pilus assembly protein CpaE